MDQAAPKGEPTPRARAMSVGTHLSLYPPVGNHGVEARSGKGVRWRDVSPGPSDTHTGVKSVPLKRTVYKVTLFKELGENPKSVVLN